MTIIKIKPTFSRDSKFAYQVWKERYTEKGAICTLHLETDDREAATDKAVSIFGYAICSACHSVLGGDAPVRNGRIIRDNPNNPTCPQCGIMFQDAREADFCDGDAREPAEEEGKEA
jgi:hypothetical protein